MTADPEHPPQPLSRPQLAVSAAIFRGPTVLLVRRARSPGKGFYSLPGGRVEYGETLAQAAIREVAEETSLAIEVAGLAGWREVVPNASHAGHYVILSFAARWSSGEPVLNEELDDFRWVAPDQVSQFKVTEGLPAILAAARTLVGA